MAVSLQSAVRMISFGSVLMPGRSRMRGECILFHSGSETKVQEAILSGKL